MPETLTETSEFNALIQKIRASNPDARTKNNEPHIKSEKQEAIEEAEKLLQAEGSRLVALGDRATPAEHSALSQMLRDMNHAIYTK